MTPPTDKGGRIVETLFFALKLVGFVAIYLFGVGLISAHCADVKRPAALYLSLAGADLASTHYAIQNGGQEANPLMRSHPIPKQLAVAGVFLAADVYLQKKGRTKQVKAVRVAYTVVRLAAVALNIRQARRSH